MARQGLRTKGGTGIWVWVLVAFGVFLVSAMASVDEPRNLRRTDSTETTAEKVIDEAHMQVDKTEGVIAELRAAVNSLRAERDDLARVRDEQEASVNQLRAALLTAQALQQDSANALQAEFQSRQADAAQTAARMAQMQQDMNTLTAQARTLQEEKDRVEAETADMITTLNARNQRILQLEGDRIPQLETQIALYIEQKDNAEAEVRRLVPQIRRLELQVNELRRHNEAAEQQIERSLRQRGRQHRSRSPQHGEVRFGIRSDAADNKKRVVSKPSASVSGPSASVLLLEDVSRPSTSIQDQDQPERMVTRKLANKNNAGK